MITQNPAFGADVLHLVCGQLHGFRTLPSHPVPSLHLASDLQCKVLAMCWTDRIHILRSQMMAINKPGEERSINSPPQEDMSILGPQLCKYNGEPLSGPQRKKLMSDSRNRKGHIFDTEHVYTFHFWQHLLDLSSYELDMSIKQFSLSRHLGGQPLQLMAKTTAGEYVWNFLMWHDSLLVEY